MSPALHHLPAYLGLLAAQVLAIACNVFLDIQYGGFTAEVVIWSLVFGWSLKTGWRQHGVSNEHGNKMMRRYLIIGGIISVLLFIPMWGFPRAGIYIMAVLLAAHNCITTTRRQLHIGLLITLVMVMFAASHYRADWTMLFYLVPYVVAVVFTLVAEQINRKAEDLRRQSLGNQVVGGQMAAIATTTVAILGLGLLLYAVTPQVTKTSLMWKWGNPTDLGAGGGQVHMGKGGSYPGGAASESGQSSSGSAQADGNGWPTPQQMRQAGSRKGMPEWQRGAIYKLADATEWATVTFQPVMQRLNDLWQAVKKWLAENRQKIIIAVIVLGLLALLYALWRLMREARTVTWIKTRIDYLSLGLLGLHGRDPMVAGLYYEAMGRLFLLSDIERSPSENTREYRDEINQFYREMTADTDAMTRLFEDSRYGDRKPSRQQVKQMRGLYKRMYNLLSH